MTACVFLGPSLPLATAQGLLTAIYLPPAKRGDIVRAVALHAPDTVILIDGYFEQTPAVWHKELLWAIEQGIVVYGAASMGALRAAELAQFGMVGVGRIFEAYRTGHFVPFDDPFDGDDEVAVQHGPQELGYPSSDALVDMRATLAAAREAGIVTGEEAQALVRAARSIFYKHRTWASVMDAARSIGTIDPQRADALTAWIPANRIRQKQLDAQQALRKAADGCAQTDAPLFRFERTLLWDRMTAEVDGPGE